MACGCGKKCNDKIKSNHVAIGGLCRFAKPTNRPWLKSIARGCYITRCSHPSAVKSAGAIGASAIHTRLAANDDYFGDIIDNAGYINVRSCVCNERDCALWFSTRKD